MSFPMWIWVRFNLFVLSMLALDLGVFHRRSQEVTIKEAMVWSGVWIRRQSFVRCCASQASSRFSYSTVSPYSTWRLSKRKYDAQQYDEMRK